MESHDYGVRLEVRGYVEVMNQRKPTVAFDTEDLFPEDAPASTSASTRADFLKRSPSGSTKIRHGFVQEPPSTKSAGSKPGMLPAFARNHRAAVLYLAVLTNWTWLSRTGDALPADTWIRFLSSSKRGALTWTAQSLSHAWSVLEENQLVTRELDHRLKKVTPLNETGSGVEYHRPNGASGSEYFVLPHEFWALELHATLTWPALAVLLILLKESGGRPYAELAVDRAQRYYGISRTTAEDGLSELRREGLLVSSMRWVQDPDAAEGRRQTSLHALADPFSTSYRQNLQLAAKLRREQNKQNPRPGRKKRKKVNNDGEKSPD